MAGQCPGLQGMMAEGALVQVARPRRQGCGSALETTNLLELSRSGVESQRMVRGKGSPWGMKKGSALECKLPDQICEVHPQLGWPQIDLRVKWERWRDELNQSMEQTSQAGGRGAGTTARLSALPS